MRVEALYELFDGEVVVLSAPIQADALAQLTQREAALVAHAVEKRQREFATARLLAHSALASCGSPDFELLNDAERAPIWPAGISGSISHCDTRAVVAVAKTAHVGTIGIDVEHRGELERNLWERVLLASEIRAIEATCTGPARGRMALVLFSAKEALYKAQFPVSRCFMDFHEVEVAFQGGAFQRGDLTCTFQRDAGPFARGTQVRGRYRSDLFASGELLTGVGIELPASSQRSGL